MNALTTHHLLRGGNDKNMYISQQSCSPKGRYATMKTCRTHCCERWSQRTSSAYTIPGDEASSYIQGLDCDEMIGLWCCLLYRALIVFDERTWPDTWRFVVKRRTDFTSIESFVSVNIWLAWTQVSRKKYI